MKFYHITYTYIFLSNIFSQRLIFCNIDVHDYGGLVGHDRVDVNMHGVRCRERQTTVKWWASFLSRMLNCLLSITKVQTLYTRFLESLFYINTPTKFLTERKFVLYRLSFETDSRNSFSIQQHISMEEFSFLKTKKCRAFQYTRMAMLVLDFA